MRNIMTSSTNFTGDCFKIAEIFRIVILSLH